MSTRTAPAGAQEDRSMRHRDWMAAAEEEYRRLGALLAELDAADWARPTDCSEWDVREVVAHLVGAAESTASVRELRRQQKLGRALRPGEADVDGMNAVQVRERADATPEQLRLDLVDAGTRGVRARRRLPGLLRALPIPFGPPLGTRPLGYLTDRIYTRDAWMHRIDIARATGRALALTAAHDGRIVADVVGEWARAHRQPHRLTLTGPAGGTWSAGVGGEEMALDAVEFCRTVSGRAPGAGLLAHPVPF
ncbi:maleylpyruvate isomerase family mycothiol-dependent enzyme [Blastococcus jejuensis]